VKAGTLDAPELAYGTELGAEPRRSVPAADYTHAQGRGWSSMLLTIEALFCRAYPSLSAYFCDVLGEDAANELDE
jgi:hypothetical protein